MIEVTVESEQGQHGPLGSPVLLWLPLLFPESVTFTKVTGATYRSPRCLD